MRAHRAAASVVAGLHLVDLSRDQRVRRRGSPGDAAVGYVEEWRTVIRRMAVVGLSAKSAFTLSVLISFTVQAALFARTPTVSSTWWRLSVAFLLLALVSHPLVWSGFPPAITRIALPMKFGFNVLLVQTAPRHFWLWLVLGNVDVLAGVPVLMASAS